jgi:hypothetical protein
MNQTRRQIDSRRMRMANATSPSMNPAVTVLNAIGLSSGVKSGAHITTAGGKNNMSTILSFNQRHSNFIKASYPKFRFPATATLCREKLKRKFGKDIQFLSYYEHSGSIWFLEGETPAGVEYQFDGVRFAGVWIPSDQDKAKARRLAGDLDLIAKIPKGRGLETAYKAMARHDCEKYTKLMNGEE